MSETEARQSTQPEILAWLLSRSVFVWKQIVSVAQQIMRELHMCEFLDMAAVYLVKHPIMTLILSAVALCCVIPVLMFVVFTVLTVMFTFTGFIFIEGTILTVGSVLLCGILLAMFIVMLTVGATLAVAYFGLMKTYGLLQSSAENSPLSHYLSSIVMKRELQVCPTRSQTNAAQQQYVNHHDD